MRARWRRWRRCLRGRERLRHRARLLALQCEVWRVGIRFEGDARTESVRSWRGQWIARYFARLRPLLERHS